MSNFNTIFRWGVEQELVPLNPFAGVKITQQKRTKHRIGEAFTPEEYTIILRASHQITIKTSLDRAKRWVPWLCAYTGARAGEMTQLRKQDVHRIGDQYFAYLTPEACTIKGGQARKVPLHSHLMDQGFLAFVAMSPDGPLFYKTPKVPVANNEFNPRRAPATTTRDMLGAWVRKLGLTDSELSPNHSWRHTFKQIAERSEISEKYHDAITGHAPASIGRSYGTPTDEDLAKALTKFPRYIL